MSVSTALTGGLVMAILSRWHGGWPTRGNRFLIASLWGVMVSIPVFSVTGSFIAAALSTLLCGLGKATGHGDWFDMGTYKGPDSGEVLSPLVDWLVPAPGVWHDFVGMTVKGFATTAGATLALALWGYPEAIVTALAGLLTSLAYFLGWEMKHRGYIDAPTQFGEVLSGFIVGLLTWMLIVG
jgi:hypothetical protein